MLGTIPARQFGEGHSILETKDDFATVETNHDTPPHLSPEPVMLGCFRPGYTRFREAGAKTAFPRQSTEDSLEPFCSKYQQAH